MSPSCRDWRAVSLKIGVFLAMGCPQESWPGPFSYLEAEHVHLRSLPTRFYRTKWQQRNQMRLASLFYILPTILPSTSASYMVLVADHCQPGHRAEYAGLVTCSKTTSLMLVFLHSALRQKSPISSRRSPITHSNSMLLTCQGTLVDPGLVKPK